MGKPRLIILIRHAQSEGNKNREIHQTTPDHRVKLTPEGQKQAIEAGKKLRALLRPDDTLHFYTSPYRRTRETTEGILSTLTSDHPTPSPFPRHTIKVYEEPRIREQDFGNFQPSSSEMARMWQERADYGHFFYRIPNGESAADAYDRISGFNESLWRSFGENDFASVCVLVTHGLMTRVFLMKWYHWSVEYFEDLRNINHCEFIVMQRSTESGKYILKNQLRTWTQYQAEKAAAQEERKEVTNASPIPVRKKWEGFADRNDHGYHQHKQPKRQNTEDLFKDDGTESMSHLEASFQRKLKGTPQVDTRGRTNSNPTLKESDIEDDKAYVQHPETKPRRLELTLGSDRLSILKTGRDGGGSRSGNVSSEDDDSDATPGFRNSMQYFDEKASMSPLSPVTPAFPNVAKRSVPIHELSEAEKEERLKQFRPPRSMALALSGQLDENKKQKHARADALGDQSDIEDEEELQSPEVTKQRGKEGSFEESVR